MRLIPSNAVANIIPGFSNSPKGSRNGKGEESGVETEAASHADTPFAPANPSAQRPSGFAINNPANLPITPPFI